MCFALAIVAREGDRGVTFVFPDGPVGDVEGDLHLTIEPQAHIGAYRVDFLVTAQLIEEGDEVVIFRKQAVVECDGYEWHDTTREQAIRDRRRDRDVQIQGFSVFRYAGAEIWVNVFKCAQEVIGFLVDAVEGQRVAASLRRKRPEGERVEQDGAARASG
jgi:very-short-patch-repair endonuclease